MEKPTLPKGTRDFGPAVMVKRQYILDNIKKVFQKVLLNNSTDTGHIPAYDVEFCHKASNIKDAWTGQASKIKNPSGYYQDGFKYE